MDEAKLKRRVQALTVAAVCLFFTLIIALIGQWITLSQLRSANERLKSEQQKLKAEAQTLAEEIAYKQSELYVEQYAREELGLVKDGEQKYILDNED